MSRVDMYSETRVERMRLTHTQPHARAGQLRPWAGERAAGQISVRSRAISPCGDFISGAGLVRLRLRGLAASSWPLLLWLLLWLLL